MASGRLIVAAIAIAFLSLAIALFLPAIVDAEDNTVRDTERISEDRTVEIDDRIEIEMIDVNQGQDTANMTVRDISTQGEAAVNLSVGNSTTVTPADENVTVTLERITSATSADVTAEFSRLYGWNDAAITVMENISTIVVSVGFIIAAMMLVPVIRV